MKKVVVLLALGFTVHISAAFSQLTIESCQEKAKTNYPLVKQYGLNEQSENYSLAIANKGYLPQFSLSVKATYQSEVTEIPFSMPGISIKSASKDQYQAVAEVNQTIWDGGAISSQKKITKASAEVEKQKTEVDMYALKDRVNQLFFGLLLLKEQLNQNELLQKELQINFDRITAYIQSGIANQSDLDAIKVEQLKTKQRRFELLATQTSYKEMLSAMIGDSIHEHTVLIKPDYQYTLPGSQLNKRPELQLFEAQNILYSSQKSSVTSGNMPKINLFVQGGYGKPGLNMLKDDFSAFYITGARLSWNFGGLYTQKNNIHKIEITKQSVNIQKEIFLYNSRLKFSQQSKEIEKINEQMRSDDEIILLRSRIKKSAEVKVENGTISVSDLIREINEENIAIREKSLHEIQLLMAIYNLKNTINN